MNRSKKIYAAKCAAILSAIPALIYAYSSGPDPRKTGAPGDSTCAESSCHIGTAVNGGGGKIEISFDSGTTYTPGTKVKVTVKVTDSAARVYGFQASARPSSNTRSVQAGTFTPGAGQFVLCEDGNPRPASGCRSTAPLEFVEHSNPNSTGTYVFDWTPPTTAAGDVIFYVAGNAANGNGLADRGDHIYTTMATLTAAAVPSSPIPALTQGGVVNAGSGKAEIASGTWVSIFGTNLAESLRVLDGPDVVNGVLPTTLDGVGVTIGGKAAFIGFVSPGQINALVPDDTSSGDTPIIAANTNGQSTPINATRVALSPAFLPFTDSSGKKYVAARHADFSVMAKSGMFTGLTTTPAKPGEVVLLFAVGLGPTNPAVAAGRVPADIARITNSFTLRIGDVPAAVAYAGVSPGSAGLYQFNVTVPDSLPNGDAAVVLDVNGVSSQDNIFITVQQ
ncbi:MAG: choice-of-anchor V domain-containing protein [Bryobacteraceae bacterium]